MVRVLVDEYLDGSVRYQELACLSTDDKPITGLATGSKCFEIDTGDTYYFDEEGDTGSEWLNPYEQEA